MTMTLDKYRKCRLDWHYYYDSNMSRKEMAKMIVCAYETEDEWFRIAMREHEKAKQLEERLKEDA